MNETDLHRATGAVLMTATESFDPSREEIEFFKTYQPAGITLFRRNIPHPFFRLKESIQRLQELRDKDNPPFLISIDQEGGRVARIQKPFPNLGPCLDVMASLSNENSESFMSEYGYVVGASLLGLGINTNFAPVTDVLTNEKNDAIGDRVFGRDPESVVKGAGAFLSGMQNAGVFGCLKHFPGQGDADFDTHKDSVEIELDLESLSARELVPFKALCQQSEMVMISHCIYPALDSKPAGLSRKVIEGLLRGDLGYSGLVVSDDMNMHAIPQTGESWTDSIIASIESGVDLVLVCRHLERAVKAFEAIFNRAKQSDTFAERLIESASRVFKLRQRISI